MFWLEIIVELMDWQAIICKCFYTNILDNYIHFSRLYSILFLSDFKFPNLSKSNMYIYYRDAMDPSFHP